MADGEEIQKQEDDGVECCFEYNMAFVDAVKKWKETPGVVIELKGAGKTCDQLLPYLDDQFVRKNGVLRCRLGCKNRIKVVSFDAESDMTKVFVDSHTCDQNFSKIPKFITKLVDTLLELYASNPNLTPSAMRSCVKGAIMNSPLGEYVIDPYLLTKHINNRHIKSRGQSKSSSADAQPKVKVPRNRIKKIPKLKRDREDISMEENGVKKPRGRPKKLNE